MTQDTRPPRFRFGLRFAMLARAWRRTLDTHLAQAGLTDATWVPLVHLSISGDGISQKTLAHLVGVDGSSLVRVIDILSREGLVERRPDANDGRARLIHLTAQGKRRVAKIQAELETAEAEMLCDIGDDEIETMLDGLERIEARVKRMQAGTEQETHA